MFFFQIELETWIFNQTIMNSFLYLKNKKNNKKYKKINVKILSYSFFQINFMKR